MIKYSNHSCPRLHQDFQNFVSLIPSLLHQLVVKYNQYLYQRYQHSVLRRARNIAFICPFTTKFMTKKGFIIKIIKKILATAALLQEMYAMFSFSLVAFYYYLSPSKMKTWIWNKNNNEHQLLSQRTTYYFEKMEHTTLKKCKINFTFHAKQNKRSYCLEFITKHSSQVFH